MDPQELTLAEQYAGVKHLKGRGGLSLPRINTARPALDSKQSDGANADSVGDMPPNFAPLTADPDMNSLLQRRWVECVRCVNAKAYLAATVMMGGLLEALLVARADLLMDKASLFSAPSTPRDRSGKVVELRQWTLAPYIDVAHDLDWIGRSAKDVATVLRDYRNYVHPAKERSHEVILNEDDAQMFWDVTKNLARQLLKSAAPRVPGNYRLADDTVSDQAKALPPA